MYLAEIFYSLKYFCFMDSIIFIVAAVYVCILIRFGRILSCRRFREMTGNSFSERKGADLFVLRNYFDAGLVPKMPRIALVECLTVLGLFLSLSRSARRQRSLPPAPMQFAWVLVLSLGTAFLSVRIVIFLSQFLVDICFVLFLTVIAAVLLIGRRRMRLWK